MNPTSTPKLFVTTPSTTPSLVSTSTTPLKASEGQNIVVALFTSWSFDALVAFFICIIVGLIFFRKELGSIMKRATKFGLGLKGLNVEGSPEEVPKIIVEPQKNPEEKPASEKEAEKKEEKKPEENKTPQTSDDWKTEMFMSLLDRDFEKASVALENIKKSDETDLQKKEDEIDFWRFAHIFLGNTESIKRITAYTSDPEVKSYAHQALAACYNHSDNFAAAIREYETALTLVEDEVKRVPILSSLSSALYSDGQKEPALTLLQKNIPLTKTPEGLAKLYEAIASYYEEEKDFQMRAFALEKAAEFRPNDTSLLFSLGHSYAQENFDALSLLHYENSKHIGKKNPALLNNLGVQYDRLEMPIKSIENYKESSENDETLASANLAYRYMNAGFKEEAEKMVNSAKMKKDVHPNIGAAMAALDKKVEDEDNTREEIIKEAQRQKKFILGFSNAWFIQTEKNSVIPKEWTDEKGKKYLLETKGDVLSLFWSHAGGEYKLEGNFSNRASRSPLYKKETIDWETFTKEYKKQENCDGFCFFSEDYSLLHIMYKPLYSKGTFEIRTLRHS